MDLSPEMKRMRASRLPPGLYSEVSEFLSSVEPDLAISGRTGIGTLCILLDKTRERGKPAKQIRKAERMIRAICAAVDADVRKMRFGAGEKEHSSARARKGRAFRSAEGQLEMPFARGTREKFAALGISDEKSVSLVLRILGEEEFGKRYAEVVKLLPRDAYRPFFSVPANANFLCSANFYDAVKVLGKKVELIDMLRDAGRLPAELEYRRNPDALHSTLERINGMMRIVRRVDGAALERMQEPEGLRQFVESVGFRTTLSTNGGYVCVRAAGRTIQTAKIEPASYDLPGLCTFMARAGISGKDMRRGGVVE